jgi:hypothetical protein
MPATTALLNGNAWLKRISQVWDNMNQWWQANVIEFDLRAQFNLLQKLGIELPEWQHLGWAFALGLTAWIAWVALSLRRSVPRVRPDRIARAWLKATRKLARVTPRAASEGPLEYAHRVGNTRPDLAERVAALALRYARLRFGPAADAAELASLEREVRSLAV